MKVKQRFLFFFYALWLIAFIQMISSSFSEKSSDSQIIEAFSSNNFTDTTSTVTATGSYGNTYLTEDAREDFLISLAHDIGITNGLIYDSVTKDSTTTSTLVRTVENANTILTLKTSESSIDTSEIVIKNVVSVEIEFGNSLDSAFYYKKVLQKAFEKNGISCDVTIRLVGNLDGELSMSEKNFIADQMIEGAHGKIVTESRDEDLFSIYAYTPNIDEYLLCGSLKTNLNVVITYDERENTTTICMATPFLNSDY